MGMNIFREIATTQAMETRVGITWKIYKVGSLKRLTAEALLWQGH